MIAEVREDEPALAEELRVEAIDLGSDHQDCEADVAEVLISSTRTSEEDLRSLTDRLNVAIPEAEPVKDEMRVYMLTASTSVSAYEREPSPPEGSEESEPSPVGVGILLAGPEHSFARAARCRGNDCEGGRRRDSGLAPGTAPEARG
jgi:hypothetical protein